MTKKTGCSVHACNGRHVARGYCGAHYRRFRLYGDPTVKKAAASGEPMAWLLAHATHTGDQCLVWPFGLGGPGYGRLLGGVKPNGKFENLAAHRVMCTLAHGEPPTAEHQAAHSCNFRKCVNPNHLRWATHVENQHDRIAHGTSPRGERNTQAILTEEIVRKIRELAFSGTKLVALARMFDVAPSTVSHVVRRISWRHIV
jgi:hypothetical protein